MCEFAWICLFILYLIFLCMKKSKWEKKIYFQLWYYRRTKTDSILFFYLIIFQNAIKTIISIQNTIIFINIECMFKLYQYFFSNFSLQTQFEASTKKFKRLPKNNLKWIKTKLYISKIYFIIDQKIARYFVQYSDVLNTLIPFYANQIINPFLTSRV